MTTSPTKWHAVSVTVAPEYVEAAEFAFNELDSLGSEVDLLSEKNSELCTVTAYFLSAPDLHYVREQMERAAAIYGHSVEIDFAIRTAEIKNQDWLAEWKKYWKPVEIGQFVIAAPWHETDSSKTVIRIEPNMAFGTGTHATTQLCLEAIDRLYRPGKSFLDIGTGTGILAIAAAKIAAGSERIMAVDTDADSIAIARTNAGLNGVGDKIEFAAESICDDTAVFDFVCANLTADVIVPMLPLLISKAKETLVLSGILVEQEKMIADALPTNLKAKAATSGEWISLTLQKTG